MRKDVMAILSGRIPASDVDDVTDMILAVLNREMRKKTPAQKKLDTMLMDADLLIYTSDDFRDLWRDWLEYKALVKKDVYANAKTQQASLEKLMQYDIRFARQLVTDAMSANYKGFHFTNTPIIYEQWKRTAVAAAGYSPRELEFAKALQRTGAIG